MSKNSISTGQTFQLGDHLLLCGDSTKKDHVEHLLKGHTIAHILTDPPYGCDVVASKKGFTQSRTDHEDIVNDNLQSDEAYRGFTLQWLGAVKAHLASKNSFHIFNSDRMMFPMKEALDQEGFKLSQLLVWVKTGAVIGRLDYLPQHELIAYGWYGRHTFCKSQDKSVLVIPKTQKNDLHPTMKPIPLLRRLILNTTRTGDMIYDPFLGSGSTLLACEQTCRKCVGIEVSPKYCQVIIDRWEKLTGEKAILLNDEIS